VVHLLDGWATDDTHHTCGAFEWNNAGLLHALEGIATSTTLETPWGPHRSAGTGGAYVMDPRTLKIRQFALPGQYNMWCYVFDEWGQGIVGDGTTANHHWDTPLSGAQFNGRKGLETVFNQEGMRPALGCEWLVSRHFPDDVQKQFTYACVINMNGMPRFTIGDDGSGFKGQRVKKDNKADDLIKSTDKHFRPADPQIGPDGALWFGDWANALVGHMQYSQRDPSRDHVRGRIYRLVAKGRPLLKPVTQFGKSSAEILEQLREPEWRTRYRARRELHDRPVTEVKPAVVAWLSSLKADDKEYDRLRCEAMWVLAGHHAVEPDQIKSLLGAQTPQARAAAVRVLSDERDRMPEALSWFKAAASDKNDRVKLEAARALSLYPSADAMAAVLDIAKGPMDKWLKYTVEHSLAANEASWRSDFLAGRLGKGNEAGQKVLLEILASSKAGNAAVPFLRTLLSQEDTSKETRNKAMTALTALKGNSNKGREVFVRACTACHKVGNGEGNEFGPNLHQVATRLKDRYKLVESVIDPNAEVDKKYLSTRIATSQGKIYSGLVISENPKEVVLFDGKEKRAIPVADIEERVQLKQSSMPEGLAGAMAPVEFLDLMEYLATLK
jgi:putative heme-binding domain-containing protein